MSFSMRAKPTLTDIHSWHGLVNQLAFFLATTPVMEPFHEQLRKSQARKCTGMLTCRKSFSKPRILSASWPRRVLPSMTRTDPQLWWQTGVRWALDSLSCSSPAPVWWKRLPSAARVGGASRCVAAVTTHPCRQAMHQWRVRLWPLPGASTKLASSCLIAPIS